ncbi:acyltransferase family protein [Alteromonas ponticola]|uniref:Acyltransferase n=1 Tax=Alteromonas ponticola TaxID=2720613 RepID=A0ABX1R4W0_9ALTE|nr:acyltransferase [Alteromonas ponticola]NMH60691.1 acyltransferase [Alteromonas ponticola]
MEIRKLNILRALAALIVFFTHFSDITHWFGGALGGGSGAYGVMLFFLLSGFLMSHLYLNTTFNTANIIRYFLARAARVLPLYLAVVIGSYWLTQNGNDLLYTIADINVLIGHLLFLHGESVLWSIPPEIHFYLFFIVLWAFAGNRKGYIYLLMVILLIVWYMADFPRIYGEIADIPYNFFSIFRAFPYFFLGVVFGLCYQSFKVPKYLKSHWFILSLCLIPLLYPQFTPINDNDKYKMWLSYEVLFVMGTLFFCVVFLVPDNNRLLANKIGDFIGKISYSLYLLHMPIIIQVEKLDVNIELKLVIALSTSIVVAYASYRFFERPLANLIRKLGKHKHITDPLEVCKNEQSKQLVAN